MEPSSPWPNDLPSSVQGHDAPTSPHAPRHEPDFSAERLERPGDHIGPFKLLDIIGEGGFGVVYLAERREPMVQRVALKIIKPGMDSKAVVARFEQERQALAVMDHPNVAKVFDAGTTPTGRPFFVMEHVKGEPITAFADRHRLTIQQRLELFIPVCDAVQHAHMKGIIHRDLKPSNILVAPATGSGGAGVPPAFPIGIIKVIDFGVAKAISHTLTDKTIFTERGQIIGTPEYMSPEQAEMGATDIDTRSDVYSLGVVLYELLAGVLPFDPQTLRAHGYAEIQRIIRETEAPKPSTRLSTVDDQTGASIAKSRQENRDKITSELRRELEWIPLKALRKDRTRRYASAESLGADVRRYLEGKPLEAAPESRGYLVRKFLRRNRVQVTAAGAVVLALVVGVLATGLALQRALEAEQGLKTQLAQTQKAQQAEKERADQLKKVSDFQSQMLGQIDTTKAGIDLMADVHERFVAALEKAGVPEPDRTARVDALRQELVRVNATDAAAAMIDRTILKPAIKTIDEQFNDDPATDASLRQALADLYSTIGLYDAAFPLQETTLATRRRVLGEEHPDTLTSINNMGVLLMFQGNHAEAHSLLREALEKRRRVLGEEHPEALQSINNMGSVLKAQGKLEQAGQYFLEAVEMRRRVLGDEHPQTLDSVGSMGGLLQAQGKLGEAEPYLREDLEKSRRVLGEEHPSTLTALNNMGGLLYDQGKHAEAELFLHESLDKRRRVQGDEHPDTLGSLNNLCVLLVAQRKFDQAESFLREATEINRRILGEEHPSTLVSVANLGGLLYAKGELDRAEPYFREMLEKRRRVLGDENPDTLRSINNLESLLRAQGKFDQAEPYVREVLEKRRRVLGEDHPDTLTSINHMGSLLLGKGNLVEAEAYFREDLDKSRRVLGEEHPSTLASIGNMGFVLQAQGKLSEAEPYHREALEKSRLVLGEEHPDSLGVTGNLGRVLQQQSKHQDAIDLLAPIEPAARKALTSGHASRLAIFLTTLGRARVGVGYDAERFTLAESNLLEAHPIYLAAKDRGPTHKDTIECVQALIDLYTAWDTAEPSKGYDTKAAEWKAKLNP